MSVSTKMSISNSYVLHVTSCVPHANSCVPPGIEGVNLSWLHYRAAFDNRMSQVMSSWRAAVKLPADVQITINHFRPCWFKQCQFHSPDGPCCHWNSWFQHGVTSHLLLLLLTSLSFESCNFVSGKTYIAISMSLHVESMATYCRECFFCAVSLVCAILRHENGRELLCDLYHSSTFSNNNTCYVCVKPTKPHRCCTRPREISTENFG